MRKDIPLEDLRDLLNQPRNLILATNFADGTTLLSPVWHEWRDGGFTVIVFDGDVKARHIKRDPRVSVVLSGDAVPLPGIEVRARAEVVPTEPDLATLRRMAVRYVGPERGNAFIDGIDPASQLTLRIVPGVLRTWDFADEPSLAT
ncbi:MAG TPA: pyridoxamine 5'-phosphate oxidase family protein [Ktedonobacterales bacterium]|nr:pyridoxamine 5'-phosphate oxidase family protein [Ktedonobacterales bacterium]